MLYEARDYGFEKGFPMTLYELLDKIRQEQNTLSAAQKQVAAYVIENYYQIPFLSISALAGNIGVSDNTIVKFCARFGYEKFAQFKSVFSEHVHSELVMFNKVSDEPGESVEQGDYFDQGMADDIAAINATLTNPVNKENLPKLIDMLNGAQQIYITGGRASSMMAGYFANVLRYLGYTVHDMNFGVGDYLDRLSMVKKEDLVIVVGMSRYTSQVVEAVRELHGDGIPVALITDAGNSPMLPYAKLAFFCGSSSGYYFPTYAGCISLIGVICRAASASRKKDAAKHIKFIEKRLLEHGVFTL